MNIRAHTRRVYELLHAINGWQTVSMALAVVALVFRFVGTSEWQVLILVLAAILSTLLINVWKVNPRRLGSGLPARLLAVAALVQPDSSSASFGWVADLHGGTSADALRVSSSSLLIVLCAAMCLAFEPMFRAFGDYSKPIAVRLPGANYIPHNRVQDNGIYWVNIAVSLILTVLLSLDLGVTTVLATVIVVAFVLFTVIMLIGRGREFFKFRRANRRFVGALTAYAPEFAFYWDAPANTTFQAAMWLPYLERVGRRFVVILRNRVDFDEVAAMTSAPVVFRAALGDLDDVTVPSLKVVCYVNSASRNTHMLRYPTLRHIQLNHGDSDKAPSVNPNFRAYDRDFVAGQAAIDRFEAAGVRVQDDLFRIVGRPQVEDIAIENRAIANVVAANSGKPTVLYAPTWAGANDDSQYCSLAVAEPMIRELLKRGYRVMFRPHGYTFKDQGLQACADNIDALLKAHTAQTGIEHVTSEGMAKRTFVDCVNESDAMIADVSSVVSDYLFSEKPLAMVAVSAEGEEFIKDFPIAAVTYVLAADMANLSQQFDAMFESDPLRAERRRAKARYLGEFALDSTGPDYVNHFVQALNEEIDAQSARLEHLGATGTARLERRDDEGV